MAEKSEKGVVPHLDPWTPRPTANANVIPPPDDTKDTGLSSEDYIAVLEAKLQKLKGRKDREPSSKDIIQGLAMAKEVQMKDTIEESDVQYSNFEDEQCCSGADREDSRLAALQRRLQPEQALSAEELKELLENDELAKLIHDLREQEEMNQQLQSLAGSSGGGSVSGSGSGSGGGGGDTTASSR